MDHERTCSARLSSMWKRYVSVTIQKKGPATIFRCDFLLLRPLFEGLHYLSRSTLPIFQPGDVFIFPRPLSVFPIGNPLFSGTVLSLEMFLFGIRSRGLFPPLRFQEFSQVPLRMFLGRTLAKRSRFPESHAASPKFRTIATFP